MFCNLDKSMLQCETYLCPHPNCPVRAAGQQATVSGIILPPALETLSIQLAIYKENRPKSEPQQFIREKSFSKVKSWSMCKDGNCF